MELTRLIEALSAPTAYPHPVEAVEVRHTHISVVFLAGPFAYKVKKPVNLGFLDFSTLGKRRHFCEEEVRLNRRLAPTVYRGVVPVTRTATGAEVGGRGEVVEWAVQMERLPEEATLLSRLGRGEVGSALLDALARHIAAFHAAAEAGPRVAAFGRFDVVAGNARENFEQAAAHMGITLSPGVFTRLRARTEEVLNQLRPLIEARADRGVPRDTHGDLHLDHVYVFPDRPPPPSPLALSPAAGERGTKEPLAPAAGETGKGEGGDLVIIDCIEFNERFRFADPVADIAFLFMDLAFHGRRDLADGFADTYFQASGDLEGRVLLPFYTAYRAAVRGKVEGFELAEKEVPEAERASALARAKAHWLLALGELEEPGRRPCLVLVAGLPGTGKSTLARGLADRAGFRVLRSDVVRKELAGLPPEASGRSAFGDGIYTPEWTERTYTECLRRAEALVFEGERVVVDANFGQERWRQAFVEAASRLAVPAVALLCRAGPDVIRSRLGRRRRDASDADGAVYHEAARRWEALGPPTRSVVRELAAGGPPDETLALALAALAERGLYGV